MPIFICNDSGVAKNDIYTWTIGDTAIEEVKSENGKPRVSEQKPSLLELLTRAGAGSSARSVVKGENHLRPHR